MAEMTRVWRRWRLSWAVHVALAGMLAAGLILYGVYAGWSARTGAASQLRAPALDLPGDMVVLAPDWSGWLAAPTFNLDQIITNRRVVYSTRAAVEAVRTTVLGPQGATTIWGFDFTRSGPIWSDGVAALQEALPLLNGRWPAAPGEVAWPANGLPNPPGLGQAVTLRVPRGLAGDMVTWTATVVGTYRPDDLVRGPIALQSAVEDLVGVRAINALFLWQLRYIRQGPVVSSDQEAPPLSKAVLPMLVATREPSVPLPAGASPRSGDAVSLHGDPVPFGFMVREQAIQSTTGLSMLMADAMDRRLVLFPAVFMLMLLLLLSVTTVTVALTLGRSEELGVYKTTGVRAAVVQRQATLEMVTTVLLGTLLGVSGLAGLVRYGQEAVQLGLPWASLLEVWLPIMVLLSWWAGRAAGILYGTAETRSLLNRTANFDWWALLRFDLTQPRA